MDCSPGGFAVHGILKARILKQLAIPFCRGSSPHRDWTWESWSTFCTAGRFFLTAEPPGKPFQIDATKFSDSFRQYITWTHLKINPINTSIKSFPAILWFIYLPNVRTAEDRNVGVLRCFSRTTRLSAGPFWKTYLVLLYLNGLQGKCNFMVRNIW